jgi:hypothetical protein
MGTKIGNETVPGGWLPRATRLAILLLMIGPPLVTAQERWGAEGTSTRYRTEIESIFPTTRVTSNALHLQPLPTIRDISRQATSPHS